MVRCLDLMKFIFETVSSIKPAQNLYTLLHGNNDRCTQFAKLREFSNVWASHIFERKVLLSVLNWQKNFEHDLLSSDSVTKSAVHIP